jgi:hypothetical protein
MVTSRADIAEWAKRVDSEEDIRPGMVVGWVVDRGISLSTAGSDKLGVVSTLPGCAMNAPSSDIRTGNYLVFDNDQCQVRMSGEVKPGDRLFVRLGSSHGTVVAITRHDVPLMRNEGKHYWSPDWYRDVRCILREDFIIAFSIAAQLVLSCSVGVAFVLDNNVRRGVIRRMQSFGLTELNSKRFEC